MKTFSDKLFPLTLILSPRGEEGKKVPSTLREEVYPPLAAPKATRG
jgi:hypothetical protein